RELERALARPDVDDLGASLDLDEVLARTLSAAVARGADAALVLLTDPAGGKPIFAAEGLSDDEAERLAVIPSPDHRTARSVTTSYSYGEATGEGVCSGVAVPLPSDG